MFSFELSGGASNNQQMSAFAQRKATYIVMMVVLIVAAFIGFTAVVNAASTQVEHLTLSQDFSCYSDAHSRNYEICTYSPAGGLVDMISLTLLDGSALQTRYLTDDQSLLVVDLQ